MNKNCQIKNPLVRDGVSRNQRLLPALDPDDPAFFKVDDRSMSDLLAFACRCAERLQYYDSENKPAGDFRPFIENDASTILALMSKTDPGPIKETFHALPPDLESSTDFDDPAKKAIRILFDLIFTLARMIDGWYEKMEEGLLARTTLGRIITARLDDAWREAIAAFNYAKTGDMIDGGLEYPLPGGRPAWLAPAEEVLDRPFHKIWIVQPSDAGADPIETWEAHLESIEEEGRIFSDPETAGRGLTALFEIFYNSALRMIHESEKFIEETLENQPDHTPHMALFLTFLRLFQLVQKDFNQLTARHLDFYYKKVLGFVEKPGTPDHVHVIFELARQTDAHLLEAGVLLKAGKDAAGVPVLYRLDRDVTLNQARVDELKTVFIDREDNDRIYAATEADSKDGRGGKFDVDEPRWKPFGESQRTESGLFRHEDEMTMDFAEIGFAISSPILQLNEGKRTIAITMEISDRSSENAVYNDEFRVFLSGEEAWLEAPPKSLSIVRTSGGEALDDAPGDKKTVPGETFKEFPLVGTGGRSSFLTITISLESDFPSIVAYDSEALGGGWASGCPMIKVMLKNQPPGKSAYAYKDLKDLELTGIVVNVDVDHVKNLIVQNDIGVLDAGKPFQPFGSTPVKGSSLYVGSDEIFRKQVDGLTLHIDWMDPPGDLGRHYSVYNDKLGVSFDNDQFKAKCFILKDGEWKDLHRDVPLFGDAGPDPIETIEWTAANPGLERAPLEDPAEEYGPGVRRGFLKLELASPARAFGHKDYGALYTRQVIALSKYTPPPPNPFSTGGFAVPKPRLPETPYTPVIKNISLDYRSKVEIDPGGRGDPGKKPHMKIDKFFQITPFGHRETGREREETVTLLPRFEFTDAGETEEAEGELYIGVKDLSPPSHLHLLFQAAEGSADPELPAQKVNWSYLSRNRWRAFAPDEVAADSTNGLLTSGIITFDVPDAADADNTLLPAGLRWLRAGVPKNSGAVCDLIDVRSQAATASFLNRGNAADYLSRPLPEKKIKKLKVKRSAVKSVSQPYASFGGEAREDSRRFYARVSERLRHKGRGVAVQDYEKLVLAKFPSIYKVKCINHSTWNYKTGDPETNYKTENLEIEQSEFAPGFVTLIVIPDLNNKNAVNPLEPRASLNLLEEIRAYLSGRISPFAARHLKVINPLYERTRVEFAVKFRAGFDRGYHQTELNKDITRFLSPWAFEAGRDIVFGGRLHKSVILNFVEERDYVDYATDFKMHHFIPGSPTRVNVDEALPTTARSILASHEKHGVELV